MSENKGVRFVKVRDGVYRTANSYGGAYFEIQRDWACWIVYEMCGDKRTAFAVEPLLRAAKRVIAAHLDKQQAEAK